MPGQVWLEAGAEPLGVRSSRVVCDLTGCVHACRQEAGPRCPRALPSTGVPCVVHWQMEERSW